MKTSIDLVKIKADLLCLGIKPNKVARSIFEKQNPCQDWKTGNVGLHILLNGISYILVTISHDFDEKSPYCLETKDDKLFLLKNGVDIFEVESVAMPNWYNEKTSSGKAMPTFFLHEGKSFIHQAYSGCDFQRAELGCKFCGTSLGWKKVAPSEIAETVAMAAKENSEYHVCLGGGTILPFEKNVEYFADCLIEIRKRNHNIPVWIEMVPPASDDDISKLVDLGATSFGFNIEIWDDKLRDKICPGKARVSKRRYLGAMEKTLKLLGINHVGSCLVVGLEPNKKTVEGAKELASIGVQSCLLPFKPWNNSYYYKYSSCNPEDLLIVSEKAVNSMINNGISLDKSEGCLCCDGCTIDHDFYNILTN